MGVVSAASWQTLIAGESLRLKAKDILIEAPVITDDNEKLAFITKGTIAGKEKPL